MFQDPYASLDPRMRVGTILEEPLVVQQHRRRRPSSRSGSGACWARSVSRPRPSSCYPHEFSGGQRQRIGLARALALDPKLIVADEPVSALDVSIQAQILNLMKELQQRHGLTYIFISHDLAVVKYMADTHRRHVPGQARRGRPGRSTSTPRPAHPYTQGLIDTIPEPDPDLARAARGQAHQRASCPRPCDPPSGCRFRTRCPFVQEVCAVEEPPLRPFGDRAPGRLPLPLADPGGLGPDGHGGGADPLPGRVSPELTAAGGGPPASPAARRRRS